MARRRYLVAYDIAEPKRLRRVCKIMEGGGDRLQYSVFICDVSKLELLRLRSAVEAEMVLAEDSVVIVDLGLPSDESFEFVGTRRPLPHSGSRVI